MYKAILTSCLLREHLHVFNIGLNSRLMVSVILVGVLGLIVITFLLENWIEYYKTAWKIVEVKD